MIWVSVTTNMPRRWRFCGARVCDPQRFRQAEQLGKLRNRLAIVMCCGSQSRAPFWQRETVWQREPLYAGFPPGRNRGEFQLSKLHEEGVG